MSYRSRRSRRSGSPNQLSYAKSYVRQSSGSRRHQYTADPKGPATSTDGSSLAANEYAIIDLVRFQRTFDVGVTNDDPPTATASNNYQTAAVFNGSKIINFKAKISIKSTSSTQTQYYDVYDVCTSFYDALIWETISSSSCLLDFVTAGGAGDNRGAVTSKTPTSSLLVRNTYLNYKFIQHYLKFRGTITLGANDSSNTSAVINLNRLPPKVRRSQTGMYYGIVLHNDSQKNDAAAITQDITVENSFEEIPSENRLPYID